MYFLFLLSYRKNNQLYEFNVLKSSLRLEWILSIVVYLEFNDDGIGI